MGHDEVRAFYQGLLQALPGLHIDVKRRHASDRAIVMEVIIRGRHLGSWRGLPATGREIDFPICGIFTTENQKEFCGGAFGARIWAFLSSNGFGLEGIEKFLPERGHIVTMGIGEFNG
jgi:SnoaL-like polyketide cyclase